MLFKDSKNRRWIFLAIFVVAMMLIMPNFLLAAKGSGKGKTAAGSWWNPAPEPENPSPYYDSILYSEIPAKLREIERSSNRVQVDVFGSSVGGRNLYLVTVTAPGTSGRFGHYKSLRKMMIRDPGKALKKLDQYKDFTDSLPGLGFQSKRLLLG